MNVNSIWSVLEEIFDLLGGYGFAAMDQAAKKMTLEPGWMTWVAAIWLFGKEPITSSNYMRMFPYGLEWLNEERFVAAVRQGYLISASQNGYFPSSAGLKAANNIWREAGNSIAHLNPLTEAQLRQFFDYLARLGEASASAPEPPSHYFISHKRENYQRFQVLYPLERFVVLFGELAAYRDDAHIELWQVHNIPGHTWEIFTLLWLDQSTHFADSLYGKLSYQGVPREIYDQDLCEIATRGWAREIQGTYQITAEGILIREEVEELTNKFFFAPWSCLKELELEDLGNLSTKLLDGLKNPYRS